MKFCTDAAKAVKMELERFTLTKILHKMGFAVVQHENETLSYKYQIIRTPHTGNLKDVPCMSPFPVIQSLYAHFVNVTMCVKITTMIPWYLLSQHTVMMNDVEM